MAEDRELLYIIWDGPHVPMNEVKEGDITWLVSKSLKEYNKVHRKKIAKKYKENKELIS